jgi:putative transposase
MEFVKRNHVECGIDGREYTSISYERERKLRHCEALIKKGIKRELALQVLQMTQATYYRWRKRYYFQGLSGLENEDRRPINLRKSVITPKIEHLVLTARNGNVLWGRNKIASIINRDYQVKVSISTVGRVISSLIKRGKIQPTWWHDGSKRAKPRVFNGHAQRLPSGKKATKPGELIQIDHMDVKAPGVLHAIKHFNAICPVTKWVTGKVFRQATATNGAEFLDHVIKNFRFPIRSIQVDGGCEFMGEFEAACKARDIALYVLPPRSPELNGNVERMNGTIRREFYRMYDGGGSHFDVQKSFDRWCHGYNHRRPHQSLGNKTPFQYYATLPNKEARRSHMS